MIMEEGDIFPDFETINQDGNRVALENLRGKKIVLYFYCKDSTPGCTLESLDFAKHYDKFKRKNAEIVGMCLGTVASHKKFAKDCNLPFDLWLDEDARIAKNIGLWKEKNLYGRKIFGIERTTFVLDEKRRVVRIFQRVKVKNHWKEVLESLE